MQQNIHNQRTVYSIQASCIAGSSVDGFLFGSKKLNKKNMTYELAKELKDKGFRVPVGANDLWQPDLSLLIEACGDGLNALIRKGQTVWVADGGKWIGGFYGNEFCIDGKSPEEVVANLWLKLNKK